MAHVSISKGRTRCGRGTLGGDTGFHLNLVDRPGRLAITTSSAAAAAAFRASAATDEAGEARDHQQFLQYPGELSRDE
jgi:hypothetical protein